MARSINLEKSELVEVTGGGLMLVLTMDKEGRMLAQVESESGGQRILIKQHETLKNTIVYYLDEPDRPVSPGLSLVK